MAMGKGELLMWTYNKTLQYPINIKCPDPKLAKVIISQYGGPDGELAASLRYLSQRFGMPDQVSKAVLNDFSMFLSVRSSSKGQFSLLISAYNSRSFSILSFEEFEFDLFTLRRNKILKLLIFEKIYYKI